jgi:putative sigma-54 modulation protein
MKHTLANLTSMRAMADMKKSSVKDKNINENYPIHVIGRHIDVTEAMKTYAIEKLRKMERFGGRVIDAFIVMDIQKTVHTVDFVININNIIVKVSGPFKE